jgi:hypothetical protein
MQYQKLTATFPTEFRASVMDAALKRAGPVLTGAEAYAALTPLELLRKVSVKEAAALAGVSADTFRRRHGALIRKITPRRCVVMVADAINLPPKATWGTP